MPDESPRYYAVLTEAGARLEAKALAEGRPLLLTHIAVGDANLEDFEPSPDALALRNEKLRRPIEYRDIDGNDPNIAILHAMIPANAGGFWIRELGVMGHLEGDAEEVLYAYANHAPYYKMLPQEGQTITHEIAVPILQSSRATLIISVSDDGYVLRREFYGEMRSAYACQASILANLLRLSDRLTRRNILNIEGGEHA